MHRRVSRTWPLPTLCPRPIAQALAITLVICGASLPASALSQDQTVPTLAPMLRDVTPGVVNIAVRARSPATENPLLKDPFFRRFFELPDTPEEPRETSATGSGVVVDARQGYVLTNNHVVEEADRIEITTRQPASPRPACRTRPWNGCRRTPGSGSGSSGGAVRRQ